MTEKQMEKLKALGEFQEVASIYNVCVEYEGVGMKIKAYKGDCMGMIIQSTEWHGDIIKVNKKSIRVRLTESTTMQGSKVETHRENLNDEVTFRFVNPPSTKVEGFQLS